MIKEFEKLQSSEVDLIFKAPILVCILVAGSDGKIDQKEIKSAIETTRKRQSASIGSLLEFYRFTTEDFEDKLKMLVQNYPSDVIKRNDLIGAELTNLNFAFPKLSYQFAAELYRSLREIALRIAQSSGGLFGVNSIGIEEAKFVNLPMINMPAI